MAKLCRYAAPVKRNFSPNYVWMVVGKSNFKHSQFTGSSTLQKFPPQDEKNALKLEVSSQMGRCSGKGTFDYIITTFNVHYIGKKNIFSSPRPLNNRKSSKMWHVQTFFFGKIQNFD
jgi:hypothetical protein